MTFVSPISINTDPVALAAMLGVNEQGLSALAERVIRVNMPMHYCDKKSDDKIFV